MRAIILLVSTALLFGCITPTPYTWQDTWEPAREDATQDITYCKDSIIRFGKDIYDFILNQVDILIFVY